MPQLLDHTVPPTSTPDPLHDRYGYPQVIPHYRTAETLKEPNGFFQFGADLTCYGQATGNTSSVVNDHMFDASAGIHRNSSGLILPFDMEQVVDNLRYERYVDTSRWQARVQNSWVRDVYYLLRPSLPVLLRKHLQKIYLRDWDRIQFPNWPVDRTVDILFERLLVVAMQAASIVRLPFIWFWPDGHNACAILTHDVETKAGRDFCERLMDIDDARGMKASFQIVPEERYAVPDTYLQTIRARGFEVNVQGLNHDGNLFRGRQRFLEKAEKINRYAEQFDSRGFRSPVLYRNIDWFQDLNFSYDMSVPNVARLEAQRGGCCTVMPYFLPGGMIELPVTATEDYTLFHILKDYSTTIWKQQMNLIANGHGLISFIVHPDYIIDSHAQNSYQTLLEELAQLRSDQNIWIPLPKEVDRWWRERSEMNLVPAGRSWKIEGEGSNHARVAYACLDGDRLVYEIA